MVSPLLHSHRHPHESDLMGLFGIVCLFFSRRPLAIHRPIFGKAFFAVSARVVPIVVNPIQSFSNRTIPHIFIERHKRIFPSRAYHDSSSSVSIIESSSWKETSVLHVVPSPIFFGLAKTVGHIHKSGRICHKTSAGLYFAIKQKLSLCFFLLSTRTLANPKSPLFASWVLYPMEDNKPSKCCSSEVFESCSVLSLEDGEINGNTVQCIAHEVDGLMFSGCGLFQQTCTRDCFRLNKPLTQP